MNIILIGPPASGKGTQAKLLEKEFDLKHFSTGDMFRELTSQNTALADEIKSYISEGKFVPDDLTIELVKQYLTENKSQNGVLFDGFPRTVHQAMELEKNVEIDYIFEIEVSEAEVIKRITNRSVCSKCGTIFSNFDADKCDKCGGLITKRDDDTAEIAKQRYQDYVSKTYPIIEYYKSQNCYHKIDGELQTNQVFEEICKIIKSVKI